MRGAKKLAKALYAVSDFPLLEQKIADEAIHQIRKKILSSTERPKLHKYRSAACKIMILRLWGYTIDPSFTMLNSLMASKDPSDVVVAHLLMSDLLGDAAMTETTPIMFTNSILLQLKSKDSLVTRMALKTIVNVNQLDPTNAQVLMEGVRDEVQIIAFDSGAHVPNRALALLALRQSFIPGPDIVPHLQRMLRSEQSIGQAQWPLIMPALRFIPTLVADDLDAALELLPSVIGIAKALVERNIVTTLQYHLMAPVWTLVECFRLIVRLLSAVLPRVPSTTVRQLEHVIGLMLRNKYKKVIRTNGRRDTNYSNSRAAAMLEAVSVVLAVPQFRHNAVLVEQCVGKVMHLLLPDQCSRSKYIGLQWFCEAIAVPQCRSLLTSYFDDLIPLIDSDDISIRRNAIRLICSIGSADQTPRIISAVLSAKITYSEVDEVVGLTLTLLSSTMRSDPQYYPLMFLAMSVQGITATDVWRIPASILDTQPKESKRLALDQAWGAARLPDATSSALSLAAYTLGKCSDLIPDEDDFNVDLVRSALINLVDGQQPVSNIAMTALLRLANPEEAATTAHMIRAAGLLSHESAEISARAVQLSELSVAVEDPAALVSVPRREVSVAPADVVTSGRVLVIATPNSMQLARKTPKCVGKAIHVPCDAFSPLLNPESPMLDLGYQTVLPTIPEDASPPVDPLVNVCRAGRGVFYHDRDVSIAVDSVRHLSSASIEVDMTMTVDPESVTKMTPPAIRATQGIRATCKKGFMWTKDATECTGRWTFDIKVPDGSVDGSGLEVGWQHLITAVNEGAAARVIEAFVPVCLTSFLAPDDDSSGQKHQGEGQKQIVEVRPQQDIASVMARLPGGFRLDGDVARGVFKLRSAVVHIVATALELEINVSDKTLGYMPILVEELERMLENGVEE